MYESLKKIFQSFARDERGLALTEYLMLLGLLTGGVLTVVIIIGASVEGAWESWAQWFGSADWNPPS